jgi:MFS family permease
VRTSGSNLSPAVKQRWVLALTSVAALMVGLDILVVTTALTTIRLHLGSSITELEWIVNAYTLSFAVLLMTASALGDRFGRRRLFLLGLGLFTAMSAAGALAGSAIPARRPGTDPRPTQRDAHGGLVRQP